MKKAKKVETASATSSAMKSAPKVLTEEERKAKELDKKRRALALKKKQMEIEKLELELESD